MHTTLLLLIILLSALDFSLHVFGLHCIFAANDVCTSGWHWWMMWMIQIMCELKGAEQHGMYLKNQRNSVQNFGFLACRLFLFKG